MAGDRKSAAVFADPRTYEFVDAARLVRAIRFRLGDDVDILIVGAAPPDAAAAGIAGAAPDDRARIDGCDHWILAPGFLPVFGGEGGFDKVPLPGGIAGRAAGTVWLLEPHGFLHPLTVGPGPSIDAPMSVRTDPHIDANVFARLGGRAFRGAAYGFPYNGYYVSHPTAFGPIDEFGFRNAFALSDLHRRADDHLVVAVFGGSVTWSPGCLQPETFCSVLQDRLRAGLTDGGRFARATVVNFGVSGHTVMNAISTYALFCERIRPQIVIAHDGFNDLFNGPLTDPGLLRRHALTYMSSMEEMIQRMMGAPPDIALSQSFADGRAARLLSPPQAVVQAYVERKRQFRRIVESDGAAFVWGFQPSWFDKPLGAAEQRRLTKIKQQAKVFGPLYEAMPMLADLARRALADTPESRTARLCERFATLPESLDVFLDHAHLTPAGDAEVAAVYAALLLDRVIPELRDTGRQG
jgi:hypothetical protein